ncbi:MAG TPA: helix-turn-helix transcriptional regulator [Gammaproteobacteria bacterium]|nr:helix-turn-helix transcriptional regulator [Gammaproteobacteria bacterium]
MTIANNHPIELNDDFEFKSRILSAVPGNIVWKDVHSKVICANQLFIENVGFNNFSQVVGNTAVNVNCRLAEIGESLIANDQFTIKHAESIKFFLSGYLFDNKWGFFICEQQFLKNTQDEVIGLSAHFFDVTGSAIVDRFAWLFLKENKKGVPQIQQGLYRCLNKTTNWNLSPRQEECLFWLLRGKSAKEIAQQLKVSSRTVEHYIELIKDKSDTRSKAELIDLATGKGLTSNLPRHWYNL